MPVTLHRYHTLRFQKRSGLHREEHGEGLLSPKHTFAAHLRPLGSCGAGILGRPPAPVRETKTLGHCPSLPFSIFSSAPTGSAPPPRSVATRRRPSAADLPSQRPLPGPASSTFLLRRRRALRDLAFPVADQCLMMRAIIIGNGNESGGCERSSCQAVIMVLLVRRLHHACANHGGHLGSVHV